MNGILEGMGKCTLPSTAEPLQLIFVETADNSDCRVLWNKQLSINESNVFAAPRNSRKMVLREHE
jgi:hypothetical protein